MKTRSHQREDTGLTRLQSHSSSFEAFSFTIDYFQWFNNDGRTSPVAGGGPARGSSRVRRDRSPRTKGRGVPPLSGGRRPRRPGRGSGNGQDSDPRARRQPGGSGPLEGTGAERRNPGATASLFAQDQPALAAQGPGRSTRTRRPHPARAMGAGSA